MAIISLEEWKSKQKKGKHKYNAVRCESKDGVKFPSKLEKTYYDRLVQAQKQEDIQYFLQQVPFRLPGNVKYIVDFMVMKENFLIEFIDVKGKMTPMSILKIKQVESLYPIKIKIVDAKYLTNNFL